MKIVLRIDGEDKTFINDFVSAYDTRKAAEINREILGGKLDEEEIENKVIDFVVNLFDGQFTLEEALKGIRGEEFINVFSGIYKSALRLGMGLSEEDENDENDETEVVEPGK